MQARLLAASPPPWAHQPVACARPQVSEQLAALLDADVALKADGITGSSDERVRGPPCWLLRPGRQGGWLALRPHQPPAAPTPP
jgi:hypothetical protein